VLAVLLGPFWLGYGPFTSLSGLGDALTSAQVGPWLWWGFAGAAVVGAVAGGAVGRDRLVAPAVVAAAVYAGAIYRTWVALQDPAPLLPGTPYDLALVGWPVTLALAVAAGAVERYARRAIAGSGPGPGEV